MKIAVIPARGGSKRIPRKNIREFCGQPMMAWSIEAAQRSGCFDSILVSTDDEEIAAVARRYGAEVPFTRPAALADDHACTQDVVIHAVDSLQQQGLMPLYVCCIYATAPFVSPADLRRGLYYLLQRDCDYALSVTSYAYPIQRALRVSSSSGVEMMQPQFRRSRSQDLEQTWHDAGQFYWGRANAWLEGRELFAGRSQPVILPRHRVQDIDTQEDWERAEWLFRALYRFS